MNFGVRQMTPQRLAVLGELVASLPGPVRALEVGSYEGASALAISHAIGERGGEVVCVDPWAPYFSGEPMDERTAAMEADLASGAVFDRFRQNIGSAHPLAPIRYVRATLKDARVTGAFDFVFIDACHRYSAVVQDIAIAMPLVRLGGILAGDDLEKQGADAYREAQEGREQDMFRGYHAGVTCAVWEAFGEVWCDEGVWAVRRTASGWCRP